MDSAKNVKWIIPFKKFGMVRVNNKVSDRCRYVRQSEFGESKLDKTWVIPNITPVVFTVQLSSIKIACL